MHRTGEQAGRQIDVGQDQVGGIHPAQRRQPHPRARGTRERPLRQLGTVGEYEGIGLGRDGEGVLEHRVGEIDRGVAQT